jgi:hypothetical protein
MRTTIDHPDALFPEAKARAALEGRKLKDLIAGYVEQGLRRSSPGSAEGRRLRSPLPLARPASGRPMPALSNAEAFALLEAEECGEARDGPSGR